MKKGLLGLCLSVFMASFTVGCDDENKSSGAFAPNDELTLKGFQIIRPRAQQLDGSFELTNFSRAPFDQLNSYQPTDQIWANEMPENSELEIEITALCLNMAPGGSNSVIPPKTSTFRFDRPIAIMETLPDQALFRPYDKPSGTLRCDFRIFVSDIYGNTVRLEKRGDQSLGKPIVIPEQRAYLEMQNGSGYSLMWSEENPLTFSAQDIVESLRLFTPASDGQDDILFDEVELHCETFTLRHPLQALGYQTHLLDLDYRRAMMKREFLTSSPSTHARQTCRFFSYAAGVLNGFSDYFELHSEADVPSVNLTYHGPGHYGHGAGPRSGSWNQTRFARLQVANPHDRAIMISLPVESHFARAQFFTQPALDLGHPNYEPLTAPVQFSNRQMQPFLFRSLNYFLYPRTELELEDHVQVLDSSNGERKIILPPGSGFEIVYSMNAQNCHFYRRGIAVLEQIDFQTPAPFRTHGVLIQLESPRIQVYGPVDKSAPISLDNSVPVALVGSQAASNGPVRMIYSTDNDDQNWKEHLALASDQVRISSQSSDGRLYPVCEGNSFFRDAAQ